MPTNLSGVWSRITDLTISSGEGSWVTTTEGEKYLDLTAGIAVASTGHCHPRVVAAIQEQAGQVIHAQVNCYHHDKLALLAERLKDVTPLSIEKFFFSNSGAEATEAAVKLAKQATRRQNIIVFTGSFHGRTHLTMAMTTSKSTYRSHVQPLPSGVFVAPFPDLLHTPLSADQEIQRCLDEVRTLLATQTAPSETAAMVLEPVQGEGGYRPAPQEFISGLIDICREHGILFIADEVQAGFGRTGRLFASDHYGIEPDIMIMAKGIASGMPLSAIGARAEIMDVWIPGSHGGTYGGNPIACAAALATLDVLGAPGFMEHVNERSRQLVSGLQDIQQGFPDLIDVRGLGLMIGIEFSRPGIAQEIISECLRHKVILTGAGHTGLIIRWMPPLVVSEEEITLALEVFVRSCETVLAKQAQAVVGA